MPLGAECMMLRWTFWDTSVPFGTRRWSDVTATIMNQKSERLRAIRIGAIIAATLSIGLLHQVTPVSAAHWHNIFQHLCYLPVVVAALMFGWRGGLLAGILAGLSPVPYVV